MYHSLGRDPSPSATAASGGPIVSLRAPRGRPRRPFIWKCSGRVRNISISPADLRSLVRFPVALKSGLDLAPRFLDSLVPLSLAQDFFLSQL